MHAVRRQGAGTKSHSTLLENARLERYEENLARDNKLPNGNLLRTPLD